jgi:ACS family hexuronate transporter-like MFS transporter
VWCVIYYPPRHVAGQLQARPAPPWRLLRTRFLASFTLAKVFVDPVWYFYIFWFPEYLQARFDFDLAAIGRTAWIPFLSAGLGSIAGGWLSGLLIRGGMPVPSVRKVSVAPFALLMTAAIPAVLVSRAELSIALVSAATFGYTGFTANTLAFPGDVFAKNMVGSIWGLASMGSGFGGMFFSWLSGRVIDRHGYTPVFIGYGLLPLAALAIIFFVMGPIRPDSSPKYPSTAFPP